MQGHLRPVALTLSLIASTGAALAQTTALKFQLDWRFEGPAALFLVAAAKGYFKDAKLDVTNHVGHGRGYGDVGVRAIRRHQGAHHRLGASCFANSIIEKY